VDKPMITAGRDPLSNNPTAWTDFLDDKEGDTVEDIEEIIA
jgi:hypothetical protein